MQTQNSVPIFNGTDIGNKLFRSSSFAWLWLIIRLYVGWEWLMAGWTKVGNSVWVGEKAGTALHGFITGALTKASGLHPDVQSWYAAFLRSFVDNHTVFFSYLVTYGEIAVGLGLILGAFTGVAAFAGAFMNLNYLMAGTVSTNPILLILELPLILAWRVAGLYGLDKFILNKWPWIK